MPSLLKAALLAGSLVVCSCGGPDSLSNTTLNASGGASFAPTGCDDENKGCSTTQSIVTAPVDGISGNSFSIMIWLKRDRVGLFENILTQGAHELRKGLGMFFHPDNTVYFTLNRDYVVSASTSPFPYDAGEWIHWALTFDKNSLAMKIFREGVNVPNGDHSGNGGTAGGTTSSSGPIYLGVKKWGLTDYPFAGSMDELQVYAGTALTEEALSRYHVDNLESIPEVPVCAANLIISLTFDCAGNLGFDAATGYQVENPSTTATAVASEGIRNFHSCNLTEEQSSDCSQESSSYYGWFLTFLDGGGWVVLLLLLFCCLYCLARLLPDSCFVDDGGGSNSYFKPDGSVELVSPGRPAEKAVPEAPAAAQTSLNKGEKPPCSDLPSYDEAVKTAI